MPGDAIPSTFAEQLEALRHLQYRSEFTVKEAPAPKRLAPFGYAQNVEVDSAGLEVGSGRLVILHDPAGQPSWLGTTRVVAYIDADVDMEVAADPMLPEVGWSWLSEALEDADATCEALGGTVTAVASRSFGVMSDRHPEGHVQIRASWTPTKGADLRAHARAWALLTSAACGLPPSSDGVSPLIRHRENG